MTEIRIRIARLDDLEQIDLIETEAGELFRERERGMELGLVPRDCMARTP